MTKTAAALAMLLLVSGCAGMEPVSEADNTITQVYDATGIRKDQMFDLTKIWIAENFRSAKSVIEYENKSDGMVIGNGVIPYPCSGLGCAGRGDWTVPFTMKVEMKDDKFRLTFLNIRMKWPALQYRGAYDGPVRVKAEMDEIKPKLLNLGDQLAESMRKNTIKTNW